MATFPALEPNTRSYDFGVFPLTEEPSLSAGIVRFRHSTTSENYQLTLGYTAITDAQATLIRNHYQGQGGGYRSFELPSIIWRGHTSDTNIVPIYMSWRYSGTPEEEHLDVGRINVTIALVSDGVVPPEEGPGFTLNVDVTLAAGLASTSVSITGFSLTVPATFEAGIPYGDIAYVAPGADFTVSVTLASGAATGEAGGGDPNFANVSLLLHMDGSNGSTAFPDSSSNTLAVTTSGNAQISTTQSKFGGAGGFFDGNGDYVSVTSAVVNTNSGDYTWEGWFYATATGGYKCIINNSFDFGNQPRLYLKNSSLLAYINIADRVTHQTAVTLNVWHHFAMVRSSNEVFLYLNGVKSTGSYSYSNAVGTANMRIGSDTGANLQDFTGYLDDIRITNGVARYTANFTPPTAAFPNS